ncbi:MAG: 5,6-dimethylbenzimidazole synthase [Rhodomicrobium sp.]
MTAGAPDFDEGFRAKFAELLIWRRDVRHFLTDPLPAGCIERLLGLACLAPSVGLSQPWRFVLVEDAGKRKAVRVNFLAANAEALASYHGERATIYARLKLAGLDDAPVQLAVFAEPDPEQGAKLGRRTMPETVSYSAVTAIHTLWLAARAEGIGMGWVSILDPAPLNRDLDVPPHWRFIGYFCVGYPAAVRDTPELEQMRWEKRCDPASLIFRR